MVNNDVLQTALEFLMDLKGEWAYKRGTTERNEKTMERLDKIIRQLRSELELPDEESGYSKLGDCCKDCTEMALQFVNEVEPWSVDHLACPKCDGTYCWDGKKLKLVSLIQTCDACPSQWEGHLEDGRTIYIRYRSGRFSIRISSKPTELTEDAVMGREIYEDQEGDGFDGYMETSTCKEKTEAFLDWEAIP